VSSVEVFVTGVLRRVGDLTASDIGRTVQMPTEATGTGAAPPGRLPPSPCEREPLIVRRVRENVFA
jgi:hypothetical protein